jgi:hypothetical protein
MERSSQETPNNFRLFGGGCASALMHALGLKVEDLASFVAEPTQAPTETDTGRTFEVRLSPRALICSIDQEPNIMNLQMEFASSHGISHIDGVTYSLHYFREHANKFVSLDDCFIHEKAMLSCGLFCQLGDGSLGAILSWHDLDKQIKFRHVVHQTGQLPDTMHWPNQTPKIVSPDPSLVRNIEIQLSARAGVESIWHGNPEYIDLRLSILDMMHLGAVVELKSDVFMDLHFI